MRFNDSLATVLSADMSTPFGAQSAWRQLVDLIGRGRIAADPVLLSRLREIRADVPVAVRAASARALAFANPPSALVRLVVDDDLSIAAPVLRNAVLDDAAWIDLLPGLSSAARAVLRHRRDLGADVRRALDSFGTVDFVLPSQETTQADAAPPVPSLPPLTVVAEQPANDTPFVSISSVAKGLPLVAEALRRVASDAPTGPFRIADLVARIDAYHRRRDENPVETRPYHLQPALFDLDTPQAQSFRFETDVAGVVRWIEGASRAPLIGLSLDPAALPGGSQVDGGAAGAFRRRAGFSNARLVVAGTSDAAGQWRISGIPVFEHANGRFTGYRGSARRPRADESAEPLRAPGNAGAEALRQLVHELRTPTNAIAGFAEMIEGELLGPVPRAYRDQAGTIRGQASDLLVAIDDIDLAARLESNALDLRPGEVPVEPLLARIADDLAPLAALRSTVLTIGPMASGLAISGDDRAVERLIGRLCATLVSAGGAGETISIAVRADGDAKLAIVFDRPRALAGYAGDAVLTIDADREVEAEGAPLLGTGFALRLVRNLAVELGGALAIGDDCLTLRLPAVVSHGVEQVSSS